MTVEPVSPAAGALTGLSGREVLARATKLALTAARLRQFQRFLANPDPTGSSTTMYSYITAVPPRPPVAVQPASSGRNWPETIAVAAGLLLAAAAGLQCGLERDRGAHGVDRRLEPGPQAEARGPLPDERLAAVDHVAAGSAPRQDERGVVVAVGEVDDRLSRLRLDEERRPLRVALTTRSQSVASGARCRTGRRRGCPPAGRAAAAARLRRRRSGTLGARRSPRGSRGRC